METIKELLQGSFLWFTHIKFEDLLLIYWVNDLFFENNLAIDVNQARMQDNEPKLHEIETEHECPAHVQIGLCKGHEGGYTKVDEEKYQ